jgi:hypothetical protein
MTSTAPELPGRPGVALDELSRERLAEGQRLLAGLYAEGEELARAVYPNFVPRPGYEMTLVYESERYLPALLSRRSAEELRCLLFAVSERYSREGGYGRTSSCFSLLEQLGLDLTVGDVRALAKICEPIAESCGDEPLTLVMRRVEQLLADGAMGAAGLADEVADRILGWNPMTYDTADGAHSRSDLGELRDEALELAGRPPPPDNEGVLARDDGFGLAAIGRLGLVEDWPAGVAGLLAHCATLKSARPAPRWQQVCHQRLAAVDGAPELVRGLLELVVTAEPVSYLTYHGRHSVLLGYSQYLVRGLVFAAGVLEPDWLPDVLRAVAVRCLRLCAGHVFRHTAVPGEKVPYACLRVLAESGTDACVLAMTRIGRATPNQSVHRQLRKLLAEVGTSRGVSADSLTERITPDHGLGADGQVTIPADGGALAGGEGWTVRLDDRQGAVLTGPAGVPAPGEATEALSEVRATVSMSRARLDALFAGPREWHVDDFTDCYLHHPLVGWLANRLVWTFTPLSGEPVSGFPGPAGDTVVTTAGELPVPAGSLVRLLHPVTLTAGELEQLRLLATSRGIRQPVRQLWRETYRLTPAERETGLFSDRYAGHVLRFKQLYGLARRRGWGGGFLAGHCDGGDDAVARRDYPAAGLRGSWSMDQIEDGSHEIAVELCTSGRLVFSPLDDMERTPVPLADVPAEVFSEAMRDLDLCVSVTTVANDSVWLETHSGHRVLDWYWHRVASGGLDQLSTQRRELLAPSFGGQPDDRFRLTQRHLIVRGALAEYWIDLATANVRMEPAGKWLSFDTRLTPSGEYLEELQFQPGLDDDEIFQRIVVRAAILADDEKLASRKLLKQIRG